MSGTLTPDSGPANTARRSTADENRPPGTALQRGAVRHCAGARADHGQLVAAGRAGRRIRHRRDSRPALCAVWSDLPVAGQAAAWPAQRTGGRGATAVRSGGGPGSEPDRGGRLRVRPDTARHCRCRAGPRRRFPQRSLRLLPGLRDVCTYPQNLAWSPGNGAARIRQGGCRMSRPDVLVDAEWAEEHKADHGLVLVEVDEDTSAYDTAHIPGAVKSDWKQDLQDPCARSVRRTTRFR